MCCQGAEVGGAAQPHCAVRCTVQPQWTGEAPKGGSAVLVDPGAQSMEAGPAEHVEAAQAERMANGRAVHMEAGQAEASPAEHVVAGRARHMEAGQAEASPAEHMEAGLPGPDRTSLQHPASAIQAPATATGHQLYPALTPMPRALAAQPPPHPHDSSR